MHSKTKTRLYRRAYVTWLISTGVNTVPAIMGATGMPRRTDQDTLSVTPELSIVLENKNGSYSAVDWGGLTLIVKSLVKRTGVRTDNFHPWGDL
ncbi:MULTISPECIES: helix-turn-helix domain-containing protein [Pseudoalteromonas]|uniref:Winged helix-turn-helix domain-containing protein n=1 Tax=Pseudoalteromonas shioyasakiensis TaxID=1190813 RepID=A0ABT6U630_9GAMM|nr:MULTISPECIES: helix-turn-helix domain-containing protein [Pseudoalteromonas]MDI4670939.1 winged helix-turn-helix domain-containing protein [Pseudoalteromonas shioyasakiensis]MDI4687849.1 winged helix-turn-helix domain-containing protein [Pseudoalteromonas shioyasakiensis]MDI4706444.1 winged helix-turn-helix domain-containing protein [Pseudoalteromonas shioyasakiensis]NUJ23592.1 helix-turn-helix domain-containing protein [Pseudoalteromonas sp. 0802]NUJ32719.1 helix-turn-helix domain-containi